MALQIRRGTDTQRQTIRFNAGELVYTTDYKDLFVGDGSTDGGIRIAPIKSLNGLTGSAATGALTITTDNVAAGATNKYYSSTQARIDAGAALVAGNVGNTGISFTYNTGANSITAVVTAGGYSLPTAAPTELGGVKISQGGLAIDGAGLLSVITPVAAGVAGQLTYYTGVNAVAASGTGLTWKTTSVQIGEIGGELSVAGLVDATRLQLSRDLTKGGLFIATQNNGLSENDTFSISTAHTSATDPVSMNLYRSRGTIASAASVQTNDEIFNIRFIGITPGAPAGGGLVAQIGAKVTGTVSTGITPGQLVVTVQNQAGALVEGLTVSATAVTAKSPLALSGYANSAARDAAITAPVGGMIVYLQDSGVFCGYNAFSGSWVVLG
jgi:hypothetical protein